jgi:hypothetical protein
VTTREYLLDVARSKLGDYRKGSPEVIAIWKEVLSPSLGPAAISHYAKSDADWCGAFTLACLREAKLLDCHWEIGSGYVLRVIGARAATKEPKPGDIGIIQRWPGATKDAWHHFFLSRWDGPNDWQSIDGNSPGVAYKEHDRVLPTTTFYSIEKLLPALPEAGFLRDGEFAVPGVQDGEK